MKKIKLESISDFLGKFENNTYYSLTINGIEYTLEPLLFNEFNIAAYKDYDLIIDHKYRVFGSSAAIYCFVDFIVDHSKNYNQL